MPGQLGRRQGVQIAEAELAMLPKNTVKVEGKEAESLIKLLETVEELDDVQKVWSNGDIEDRYLESA